MSKVLKATPGSKSNKVNQLSRGVLKTVAGMALTSPLEFVALAAHAGDRMLKSQFSEALADTYTYFLKKGEIDPQYFDSTDFADLAPEFGRLLSESFGVEKLDAIRKIFANLAKGNGKNSHKKYLLDLALEMSEGEIKVLIASYDKKELPGVIEPNSPVKYAASWLKQVAEVSGLKHEGLVETAETSLMSRNLLTKRTYTDGSGVVVTSDAGRLTSLGQELYYMMMLDDDAIADPRVSAS